MALAGCTGGTPQRDDDGPDPVTSAAGPEEYDGTVTLEDGRGLHLHCVGEGSPTVMTEAGDEDAGDAYDGVVDVVAETTRICQYDRANLGSSDTAPGPRQLDDLVGDLAGVLEKGEVPGPYLLVGSSGGGYIVAGYAETHPDQTAGVVLVDTSEPFPDPPRFIVEETDPDAPENVEHRDYLQVEKDAWAGRTSLGDIPVIVISNEFTPGEIDEARTESEKHAMRTNVAHSRGWFALSPHARQVVVHTGHDVTGIAPDIVASLIVQAVDEVRGTPHDALAEPTLSGPLYMGGDLTQMTLECFGHGSPTVLLEAGDDSGARDVFPDEMLRRLARHHLTCAYDRLGTGRSSEPSEERRSLSDVVAATDRMLSAAGVPGPYLLVGSSGGGMVATAFARLHPERVAGLVLLDVGVPNPHLGREFHGAEAWGGPEHIDWVAGEREMALVERIGTFPVLVLAAADGQTDDPRDQRFWFRLSPRSTLRVVPGDHDFYQQDPAATARAVLRLAQGATS